MTIPAGLLPEGLRDRLPGEAAAAQSRVAAMLAAINAAGFATVSPPLVEYEEGLAARLQGKRTDLARFVDPKSQRLLAVRSDITPQVARIAATVLADAPRPLKLGYAGQVVKLASGGLDPARERTQLGAELIGADTVDAALEIVALALATLRAGGAQQITVDLTLPDLVSTLCSTVETPDRIEHIDHLLDMKDAGGLSATALGHWLPLLGAMDEPHAALAALKNFDHAGLLTSRIDGVARIADALAAQGARVTIDPTERHGFEYQSWFGFSLFAGDREIGRGGSYAIVGTGEPAVGFSIYPDTLE
ncbi:MAG TPA: ATP phosphoribosyltransferase regulatory subunit [Sphingomonas sp.]|jgi:ATP phosphoribosyltransferase regulatory subunit|nr:ATP phosphoribosyltransferase regulatory subunit [Sphingomonas sp.]